MILDVILLIAFAVGPAIILHECAHGWSAYLLGDPTAKEQGRLTLNPIKHIDPIGSIVVPGALFLMHAPIFFGWAKPVPVNFMKLKNPRIGMMLVAAAGPITNVILAFLYIWLYKFNVLPSLSYVWQWAILFNIALCVFNLIPIPPLDGSRIVMGLLPGKLLYYYARLEPFGLFIILILLQLKMLSFMYPMMSALANLLGIEI